MSLLPPNAFDPPVTRDGKYSPAFLRLLEEIVAAINALDGSETTTPDTPATELRITGSGWINVTGNEENGFNVAQRESLATTNLPEGTNRYANHSAVAFDFDTDANLTLTPAEYRNAFLELTDTGPVLTTGRDVVFPDEFPLLLFKNSTAQTLTLKKNGQTGVTVAAGAKAVIAPGLTDVEKV